MAGGKGLKKGAEPSGKALLVDVAPSASSSPRVVSMELMALLRRGNASAVKRWLKSGGDVHQVLHAPQLDKTWGFAAPAVAAATAAAASPAAAAAPSSPSPPPGHWPLILLSCAVGSAGAVELLLRAGADPNARNVYGLTALVAAVHNDGLAPKEKLVLARLLHRHGFSLFGASCEALGERATAATALLHQLAVAGPETQEAAVPLLDWLLQLEPLPLPAEPPLFQHLCFSLALEPAALRLWLPLLYRRSAYVPGSQPHAELLVGIVAAAHQLREARAAAAAQAVAASSPPPAAASGVPAAAAGGRYSLLDAGTDECDLGFSFWSAGGLGEPPPQQQQQARRYRRQHYHSRDHQPPQQQHNGGSEGLEFQKHGESQLPVLKGIGGGGSGNGHAGDDTGSYWPAAALNGVGAATSTPVKAGGGNGGGNGAVRHAAGAVAASAATHRELQRERSRQGARARAAARAAATAAASSTSSAVAAAAAAAAAAAVDEEAEGCSLSRGGDGDEAAVLRAFLECGLNPNVPMCADGLLPMQRLLEKPELLGVLLEGGMDPRVRAGTAPLDLTFLHTYALIGRFQSTSEAAVQACALMLSRDPGLVWVRCAGLTPFQLALAHSNLAMAEHLAAHMGPQHREAVEALRQRMLGTPASYGKYGKYGDGLGLDADAAGTDKDEGSVARRVWDPMSPSAAAAAVAAAVAASPVTVPGQDGEVASSYRLLCLALQRPDLWDTDMSGLMRQVPLMDVGQLMTLLDILNSPNLFNVVAFLEHCRAFAQRVILQVLQLGVEGHELMQAAVPPPAVQVALAFLRANPDNIWLQSVAKFFPPLVDAMVADPDTRELMLVAPQRLLDRADEIAALPPDLVQAAVESARAAMLLENGFYCPRPALEDLEGPLRRYASVGYPRLLLRLLRALPAAAKHVWHDLHVLAYLPEVAAQLALDLCASPDLAALVAEALTVVQACMTGRPAATAKRGAAAVAAMAATAAAADTASDGGDGAVTPYTEAVDAVVAHLAAHLGGMSGAAAPPPPQPATPTANGANAGASPEAAAAAASSGGALAEAARSSPSSCSAHSSFDASVVAGIHTTSYSSSSGGRSGSSSDGNGGSGSSSGCCSPTRPSSPPAAAADCGDAAAAAAAASSFPAELTYLEDVVVEQTELLTSLYCLMAVCSLAAHLLCPDYGLGMCSREFRTRMTAIPDATVDDLAAKHGAAFAGSAPPEAASSVATAPPPAPPAAAASPTAAAATAAAVLAAYPRSGALSLDQLYAQLLGNLAPVGAEQRELVESRREFLKQVLAMDSMWREMQLREEGQQDAERSVEDGGGVPAAHSPAAAASAAEHALVAADGSDPQLQPAKVEAAARPAAPLPPRRPLLDPELVSSARRAVLAHPVIWSAVRAVAALPAAPAPRPAPGVRVLWDDDNLPIYVLTSLAARRAVETAARCFSHEPR